MKFIILFFCFVAYLYGTTDKDYLQDLPSITPDSVRWNMPADIWLDEVSSYTMKGRLFKIMKGEGGYPISIFNNPKLEGDSLQIYSPEHFEFEKKRICHNSLYAREAYNPEKTFICHMYSCKSLASETEVFILNAFKRNPYSDSAYLLSEKNLKGNCSDRFDIYTKLFLENNNDEATIYKAYGASQVENTMTALYFPFEEIDKDRNYIVVNLNGKKGYVDIRHCKKKRSKCEEVNLEYSEFERDWIVMKKHQQNKDLDDLNALIKELKPCVEKKDIPCIKKYVVNIDTDKGVGDGYYQYSYLEINENNEDLFKELSACLDYDKLLPHLYGTRGIDKVCIWPRRLTGPSSEKTRLEKKYGKSSPMKIIGVAYPEAVRIGDQWAINYIRK